MSKAAFTTGKMVRLAVLVAIQIIMVFTPLGYLKAGPVSITFLMIPVAIASIILGPGAGAFMGGIFGITSFAQCFGADAFGTALLAINPVLTFIMCMVPRILAGWLPGLIFNALSCTAIRKTASAFIAGLCASAFNTIFFVGALVWFFGNAAILKSLGDTTWKVIGVLVTSNALIEAAVCTIVSGAVGRALIQFIPVKNKEKTA